MKYLLPSMESSSQQVSDADGIWRTYVNVTFAGETFKLKCALNHAKGKFCIGKQLDEMNWFLTNFESVVTNALKDKKVISELNNRAEEQESLIKKLLAKGGVNIRSLWSFDGGRGFELDIDVLVYKLGPLQIQWTDRKVASASCSD